MSSGVLQFTTVPSGFDATGAFIVTVHISPKLDANVPYSILQSWTSDVLNGVISFNLTVQAATGTKTFPIAPTKSLLHPDLWNKVFGPDTPTVASNASATPAPSRRATMGTGISENRVNLRDVVANGDELYQNYLNKVDITQKPGIDGLRNTAKALGAKHSLYALSDSNDPDDTQASAYLAGNGTTVGKNLAVTRIFGNINVAAGFPTSTRSGSTPVKISGAAVREIAKIHGGASTARAGQQHVLNHIHRMRSVSRKTLSNIAPGSLPAGDPSKPVPMSFQQRISVLQNMPALLEALGLVLEFVIGKDTFQNAIKLNVGLAGTATYADLDVKSPFTYVDAKLFMPLPIPSPLANSKNPVIGENGYVNVAQDYSIENLQPEAASQQTFNFSNQAVLRLNNHTMNPVASVTRRLDEDYKYVILPHSPHTDGMFVYQNDRQKKVKDKVAAGSGVDPTTIDYYAEDLFHSFAVDVWSDAWSNTQESGWSQLTLRDEQYFPKTGPDTPFLVSKGREHGVRTSATKPTDTVQGAPPQEYLIDEALFTWRYGSLALLEPVPGKGPLKSGNKQNVSVQQIPWGDLFKAVYTLPSGLEIPPQRFGKNYSFSLRPVYITGRARAFDLSAAQASAVPTTQGSSVPMLKPFQFLRYEMVLGPRLIGRKGEPIAETQSLMYVSSRIKNPQDPEASKNPKLEATPVIKESVRYLVPGAATASVARRHGMRDDLIKKGAKTIPLQKQKEKPENPGALPAVIPFPESEEDYTTAYVPDPMCDGVQATLYFIGNTPMPQTGATKPVPLKFYLSSRWPDYVLHCIVLKAGKAGSLPTLSIKKPGSLTDENKWLTRKSRVIQCTLPPGMTAVLELTPTIDDKERNVHRFSQGVQLENSNVCRPTIVRMTHATDIPVVIPDSVLNVRDDPHQTVEGLPLFRFDRNKYQSPTVTTTFEPYTTSKVSIEASWTDKIDDVSKTAPADQPTNAAFFTRQLPKSRQGVPATNIGPASGTDTSPPITLPWSDSRYRRVMLTIAGISRYATVIPAPTVVPSRKALYDFLSIAAPPVPDIEYVMPTFQWQFEKHSRTRTCGLAVVLNRPWFVTGAGEQLAVILPSGSQARIPSTYDSGAENQVSAWGTHAIWATAEKKDMYIELQSSASTLNVNGQTIAAFDPVFDELEQRWYCNLSFSDPPVYGVLMRLALARYQRNSISDDKKLSAAVMTDFALLGPSRVLEVRRSHGKLEVTIRGVGPDLSRGSIKTVFEVLVATEADDDLTMFNWREGDSSGATDGGGVGPSVLWHGFVTYPDGATNSLVIREYETGPVFEKDDQGQNRQKPVYACVIDISGGIF